MFDINKKLNDDIDKFFIPHLHLLRYFKIPNELYDKKVLDFRKYFWGEHESYIYTGSLRDNRLSNRHPRRKVDITGGDSRCDDVRIVLCDWLIGRHGHLSHDTFLLLDKNKELTEKKVTKRLFGYWEDVDFYVNND